VYFDCFLCKNKLLGTVSVSFDEMCQLMIIYFGVLRFLWLGAGGGITMKQCIEFKDAYDSVGCNVLYHTLIEFSILIKL